MLFDCLFSLVEYVSVKQKYLNSYIIYSYKTSLLVFYCFTFYNIVLYFYQETNKSNTFTHQISDLFKFSCSVSFLKSLVILLLPVSGWSDVYCHAVPLTTLSSSLALDDTNNSLLVPTPRPALPISAHSRAISPCPRKAIKRQSPAPCADVSAHLHPHGAGCGCSLLCPAPWLGWQGRVWQTGFPPPRGLPLDPDSPQYMLYLHNWTVSSYGLTNTQQRGRIISQPLKDYLSAYTPQYFFSLQQHDIVGSISINPNHFLQKCYLSSNFPSCGNITDYFCLYMVLSIIFQ